MSSIYKRLMVKVQRKLKEFKWDFRNILNIWGASSFEVTEIIKYSLISYLWVRIQTHIHYSDPKNEI